MDPVLEGHRKRGINEMRDTGLEGGIQGKRYTGTEEYKTGGKNKMRVRTGGMWNRRDSGQEG